jgi:general secretion pathway protein H
MPTSAAGNKKATARGFTLLELLVVVAIVAMASAGVTLALRDSSQTRLERDAQRLAALLESGRAQSRATGVPVRWTALPAGGFRFDGVPPGALPDRWLADDTTVLGTATLLLGPEPLIGRQAVTLSSQGQTMRIGTDGLRPFALLAPEQPQ